jgi:parallel beta-helix repeat protein
MSNTTFIIEGNNLNNQVIDGNGQVLEGNDCLLVKSIQRGDSWLVPENITIKNFNIKGSVRIIGLGINGEGELVKKSSKNKNHTEYAQSVAPKNIVFDNLNIEANKRTPFYISPGCTNITLKNCEFTGNAESVAIYLDCESSNNVIQNNIIKTKTKREAIAVDGSAHNLIQNNTFYFLDFGGIYLYRNLGEGGTIRHQTPSFNKIINNTFKYDGSIKSKLNQLIHPAIWLGSRSGIIKYFYMIGPKFKDRDTSKPFGSSLNPNDLASKNVIKNNIPKSICIRNWETL